MESRWGWARGNANPGADANNDSSSDEEETKQQTTPGGTRIGGNPLLMYSSEAADSSGVSNHELKEVIESQKREIKYLNEKIQRLDKEKQDMIENFKLSSSVLLERIKDLEA